jgi:lysophospholipid acyltransferase (LPLAT)-like uncharacterized protein
MPQKFLFFLRHFLNLLFVTLRFHSNRSVVKSINQQKTGTIYCCWHENIMGFCQSFSGSGAYAIVSPSRDGQLLSAVLASRGIRTIVGSSNQGGMRALREAVRRIKQGHDILITPDGPRGPRRQLKSGLAQLAQLSGAPVVVVNYRQASYVRLKSWDRFIIPLFFTRVDEFQKAPLEINFALPKKKQIEYLLTSVAEKLNENNPARDYSVRFFWGLID